MKRALVLRALAGVALIAFGLFLAAPHRDRLRTVIIPAGACSLTADVLAPVGLEPRGSVILLHGLVGTKKVMSYLAHGFADQGLLVITPDLPGHGRSPGPFSPIRAEECAASLVNTLASHGLIDPTRTLLVGHSMGGAIAVRVAAKIPVAGVIAISPAPMRSSRGIWPEMLLYTDPAQIPPNSLVISGAWEPSSMRGAAEDLLTARNNGTSKCITLPHATHVSLLFDSATIQASQSWTAKVLRLSVAPQIPSHAPLFGFALGFAGLILLTAPFLRETLGSVAAPAPPVGSLAIPNALVYSAASAFLSVFALRLGNPLRFLGIFEGDYLAGFLTIVGILMLLLFRRSLFAQKLPKLSALLLSVFAAFVLLLLFTGWFDYSFSEAWLTSARWLRFPVLLLAFLPCHIAEELFLSTHDSNSMVRGLVLGLSTRAISWLALLFALLVLHNGQILFLLLALYFFAFSVLQRLAMDVVRKHTASPACSSLFGAILFAGFCLAIFPVA